MNQAKSVAVYCRVSTKAQAEDGTSLDSQEKACRRLAGEKSRAVEKVFKEDWPGDTLDRPLLRQLRDQLKQGMYSAVICHATDRLARKPVHLAIIAEECEKAGAELLFVTEPLDNSAEGQLIRYVKGYAAEIEREKIRERTMRGKQARAEKGMLPHGTGKGTYGYHYDPETGRRSVVEAEAEVVRQIFNLCAVGTSCHSIAVTLNRESVLAFGGGKWHPRTVNRMLTNSSYKGVTIFGQTRRVSLGGRKYKIVPTDAKQRVEIRDATPPIVSAELWSQAQKVLSQPRRHPTLAGRKYLLTGYGQCECGAPLVGTCLNKVNRYYRCRATWPTSVKPKSCDAPYVRAEEMEEQVWKTIVSILKHPDVVMEEIRRRQGETSVLDDEIERVQHGVRRLGDQERRLVRLYTLGEIDDGFIKKEMEQIKRQRAELEAEQVKLEKQKLQLANLGKLSAQVREFCARASAKLNGFSFEDKRMALRSLQVRIVVGKAGVKLFGAIPSFNATTARTWA
ncbi:MAG: recombinase family protein [Chloroflexi bacterium]|nr:recombinase family protein [Chloroflexota bacterium]